jgi:hypothetical protein
VPGCNGRAADAEHQRRWWLHIYVLYVPPNGWYARFAMPAMFGALEAEVRWLLIRTHNSGGPGDGTLASQAPSHLFRCGFLQRKCAGTVLGSQKSADSIRWMCCVCRFGNKSVMHIGFNYHNIVRSVEIKIDVVLAKIETQQLNAEPCWWAKCKMSKLYYIPCNYQAVLGNRMMSIIDYWFILLLINLIN